MIDNFNPLTNIFLKWSTLSGGDIFQSIVIMLQIVLKVVMNVQGIILLAAFLVAVSICIGIIFSGYFGMVNNALEGKPKERGEFTSGIKRFFFRIFLMSFAFLFLTVVFAVFILVASVPAMVITNAALSGSPELLITAVVIDFITLSVVFLGFMFFRTYMSFWYPAAMTYGAKAFIMGKRTADGYFWGLVSRFIAFDIIFILFQLIIMGISGTIAALIIKWIFYTAFFSVLITYVFAAFKILSVKNKRLLKEEAA